MQAWLDIKPLSSMEKCFPDEALGGKPAKTEFYAFYNQRLCFQVACRVEKDAVDLPLTVRPVVISPLSSRITLKAVQYMPVRMAADLTNYDENYLHLTPGLYPDALRPLLYQGKMLELYPRQTDCLWVQIEPDGICEAGVYPLEVELWDEKNTECLAKTAVQIEILPYALPEQTTCHTEWFYTDCLAEAYRVRAFSEKHWHIIENYIDAAVKNGINMILTPLFTPELDTYIGGERMTTQLVNITRDENGAYSFDFSLLSRWISLCLRLGVKYFEMPHFFSQWGAKNAPKIVATCNGIKKRIFGWKTDSMGEEYGAFLAAFIPALTEVLKQHGIKERTYFHISDEPNLGQLERYRACSARVLPYLEGCRTIDALSRYEFYKSGAVDIPIPSTAHVQAFIDRGVSPVWTYYSGAHGCKKLTGRYLSMPSSRTRMIGLQMYMSGVEGFLHWGYNFWHTKFSYDTVEARLFTDCAGFNAAGDCFLVYAGEDGKPWESLRLNAMREAMEDIRMLRLHESRFGSERTKQTVLELAGGTLNFEEYPHDDEFFFRLQKKVIDDLRADGQANL